MEITSSVLLEREFLPSFQSGFKSPWTGSIENWAAENVVLTIAYRPPGAFSIDRSRYMIDPLAALNDTTTRQLNIMAPPRSGKTLLGEIFMLYTIANNPSSFLWVQQSKEQMDKLGGLRMQKLLRFCKPVKELLDPEDRFAVTQKHFKFTNDMSVILGSAKIADLSSVGYRYIVGDEAWQWEEGFIAEAHSRTDDFKNCSKELYISQGGLIGSEWDTEFKRGTVYEWGWICPKCKKEQSYVWNYRRPDGKYAGLQWDASFCKDGIWDIQKAGKSSHMSCVHCLHKIEDTTLNRWSMMRNGVYIKTSDGLSTVKSFRWNSMAIPLISWSSLVEEFLFASEQEKMFNTVPMEKFDQKKLAISYGEKRNQLLLEIAIEDYDINAERPDTIRFLAIDVQESAPHMWYLIREWDMKSSDSRLITYGSCNTWVEINDIRIKNKVKEFNTLVDSGYATKDIYTICAKAGRWGVIGGQKRWLCYLATKGTASPGFKHNVKGKEPVWKFFTEVEIKGVNFGNDAKYSGVQGCPFVAWSTIKIKNILNGLVHGHGPKWVAKEVDDVYRKQMTSERAIAVYKNGRKETSWEKYNHKDRNEFWDLEALQCLAANMAGILKTEREVITEDEKAVAIPIPQTDKK
jgi:hypothetical protein